MKAIYFLYFQLLIKKHPGKTKTHLQEKEAPIDALNLWFNLTFVAFFRRTQYFLSIKQEICPLKYKNAIAEKINRRNLPSFRLQR